MPRFVSALAIALFSLFYSPSTQAQVIVDGIDINKLDSVNICKANIYGRTFSTKVFIEIDYGQVTQLGSSSDARVMNNLNGKVYKFNSVIHAINYMENNGWKLVDALPITVGDAKMINSSVEYYFRKIKQ